MMLIKAIRHGDAAAVRTLLAGGADPNESFEGELPLVTAIDQKQAEIVRILLEYRADVNSVDGQGHTPLIVAAGMKNTALVRRLIAAGARNFDVIPEQFPPLTALMLAAYAGQVEIARMLLEAGADPSLENRHGQSPLVMGADHPDVLSLLIQHGADPNRPTSAGYLPLVIAASKPRGRGLRPLLAAGANPNVTGPGGETPLLIAVRHKLAAPVRWLLEAGADPNVAFPETCSLDSDASKRATPLIYAARSGRMRLVETLLNAGARWDVKDDRGRTAYDAALAAGHADMVELLEGRAGAAAPTGLKTREYFSRMLLWSVRHGKLARVREALDHHADPNVTAERLDYGVTPLMFACRERRTDLVELLISRGADVHQRVPDRAQGDEGRTALHVAAECGHAEGAARLLAAGAHPDVFDTSGHTPLMYAAREGHLACVQALLRSGAAPHAVRQTEQLSADNDEDAPDADGDDGLSVDVDPASPMASTGLRRGDPSTALGLAAHRGYVEVMRELISHSQQIPPGPLLDAVAALQVEAVRCLLALGDTVRQVDSQGLGPLHALGWFVAELTLPDTGTFIQDRSAREWHDLATERQLAIARMLLSAGADVHAADRWGRTPLMLAASAQTFLSRETSQGDASMHDFARSAPLGYVQLLLSAGADVSARDHRGNTPLHHAFCRGFMERAALRVVHRLVRSGVAIDAQNALGQTPLMLAVRGSDARGVRRLLRLGARVDLRDERGQTVLHLAAVEGRSCRRVLPRLLRAGADPTLTDADGNTALDAARNQHEDDAVRILRKVRAPETASREFELAEAIDRHDSAAVRNLLDGGADVRRRIRQQSPFVRAVLARDAAIVAELVERGADLQETSEHFGVGPGCGALHFAAQLDDPQLLDLLLRLGADPHAQNGLGWTALTMACISRRPDLVTRLQEHGVSLDTLADDFLELTRLGARTATDTYRAAVQQVSAACGTEPQPLPWADGLVCWALDPEDTARRLLEQDAKLPEWVARSQAVRQVRASLIERLSPSLAAERLLLVGVESGRGFSPSRDFLALFPTTNPFALIAAMGVFGNDAGISCPELVERFRQLHQQEPFDIRNLKNDTVDIDFRAPVHDPRKIAHMLYRMCPDIIDQGFDTMKRLVEHLQSSREVHFWWD
jgi:ankyrin repeat protein